MIFIVHVLYIYIMLNILKTITPKKLGFKIIDYNSSTRLLEITFYS